MCNIKKRKPKLLKLPSPFKECGCSSCSCEQHIPVYFIRIGLLICGGIIALNALIGEKGMLSFV